MIDVGTISRFFGKPELANGTKTGGWSLYLKAVTGFGSSGRGLFYWKGLRYLMPLLLNGPNLSRAAYWPTLNAASFSKAKTMAE